VYCHRQTTGPRGRRGTHVGSIFRLRGGSGRGDGGGGSIGEEGGVEFDFDHVSAPLSPACACGVWPARVHTTRHGRQARRRVTWEWGAAICVGRTPSCGPFKTSSAASRRTKKSPPTGDFSTPMHETQPCARSLGPELAPRGLAPGERNHRRDTCDPTYLCSLRLLICVLPPAVRQ
jgi:hypothetical protein